MLIEKIEAATFSNGILRVQTARIGADGKIIANETLHIPGNLVGDIINSLVGVSQDISSKLEENSASADKKDKQGSKKEKKKNN